MWRGVAEALAVWEVQWLGVWCGLPWWWFLEAPRGAAAGGEGKVQAWTFNGGEAWCVMVEGLIMAVTWFIECLVAHADEVWWWRRMDERVKVGER